MSETRTYHRFVKAHGLTNDFVIFDGRRAPLELSAATVRRIADRRAGVGCDQLIVLRPSDRASCFMAIYNADGSEVGACGNATRCVGDMMIAESGQPVVQIETAAGLLDARQAEGGITVNMGQPRLDWSEIPLSHAEDTSHVTLSLDGLKDPVCVNMGNPHVVFFTADVETVDLARIGPRLETDPLFPERVNVSVASVQNGAIRLRVWERGAGITPACGTAACATVVAAVRRGLIDGRQAVVTLDGGPLDIIWDANSDTVMMTGPSHTVFEGQIAL